MSRVRPLLAALAAWPLLAAPAVATPAAELAVAVAPFAAVVPEGAVLPDIAQRLADRLATRGVGRVIGPAQLGAPADPQPAVEAVREWAARSGADVVVVGRATRLGESVSLDVRVREGRSGAVVSTLVAEAARADELDAAVDHLAARVVASAEGVAAAALPARAAGALPEPTPEPTPAPVASGPPVGLLGLRSSAAAPLSIRSQELEAVQSGRDRRFLFTGRVEVRQGDLLLTAERLEAVYAGDSSEPRELVASGSVVLTQRDRRARCDRATYLREARRVICEGNAQLEQGGDRVRGQEMVFDLHSEHLVVRGGADVRLERTPLEREGEG